MRKHIHTQYLRKLKIINDLPYRRKNRRQTDGRVLRKAKKSFALKKKKLKYMEIPLFPLLPKEMQVVETLQKRGLGSWGIKEIRIMKIIHVVVL